jgi:hypothetical protein
MFLKQVHAGKCSSILSPKFCCLNCKVRLEIHLHPYANHSLQSVGFRKTYSHSVNIYGHFFFTDLFSEAYRILTNKKELRSPLWVQHDICCTVFREPDIYSTVWCVDFFYKTLAKSFKKYTANGQRTPLPVELLVRQTDGRAISPHKILFF